MALVLSRRVGEEIRLTLESDYTHAELEEIMREGIAITVTSIEGSAVKLAFDAPGAVTILRSELLEQ